MWIALFISHIIALVVICDRQPGGHLGSAKACIGAVIPLHRAANRVTAMLRMVLSYWIMHQFSRQQDVLHAQLVTIIAGGGSAQCEQQHLGQPRLLTAHTSGDTRLVMI